MRRRVVAEPYGSPWGWAPYGWYGWPWAYYPGRLALEEVYLRALPMGPLQPGARLEGFVYFPRLRPDARGLRLEFHHQVGDRARVLTLPFAIDRGNSRSAVSLDRLAELVLDPGVPPAVIYGVVFLSCILESFFPPGPPT